MTAWSLTNVAANTYAFPVFTLASEAHVHLWTKSGDDDADLCCGQSKAVRNNMGDTAFLRDAAGV